MLDCHNNLLGKFYQSVIERLEKKRLDQQIVMLEKVMVDLKYLMQFHTDVINENFHEVCTKTSQVYVVHDKDI